MSSQQTPIQSGTYFIWSHAHSKSVLDASPPSSELGERIIGYPQKSPSADDTKNQLWEFTVIEGKNGNMHATIKNVKTGKFLRPEKESGGSGLVGNGGEEYPHFLLGLAAKAGERQRVVIFREGGALCLTLKSGEPKALVTLEPFKGTKEQMFELERHH